MLFDIIYLYKVGRGKICCRWDRGTSEFRFASHNSTQQGSRTVFEGGIYKKRAVPSSGTALFFLKRRLPTLPLLRSTIGVIGLNFSVRDGKRWNPNAITTLMSFLSTYVRNKELALCRTFVFRPAYISILLPKLSFRAISTARL